MEDPQLIAERVTNAPNPVVFIACLLLVALIWFFFADPPDNNTFC